VLLTVAALLLPGPLRAGVGDNEVGMNTHLPHDDMLDACQALGLQWIRIDVNWFQGERQQGRYTWDHIDPIVAGAQQRGLQVFMTVSYGPDWASSGNREGDRADNDVPRPGLYEAYLTQVVRRYRDRVTHYGLWNEANLDHFWEGSWQEYVDVIVRPGAAAVRAECPGCLVLGPELAGISDWQEDLEDIMSTAGDEFDIITHHTYKDFAETHDGWMWTCDDFTHAIESSLDPLLCFYKKGLVEVLEDSGVDLGSREVWISETGYRADPGDADEERRQAVYVQRVLEEQLGRPWWTNSFFYELQDCECGPPGPDWGCMPEGTCDIDGYGLLRRSDSFRAGGGWESHFRVKPAFEALGTFIAEHPQFQGAPATECGDGADNDGDGLVDLADPGCADGADDDEGDEAARPRTVAPLSQPAPVVDGDLSEWAAAGFERLGPAHWVGLEEGYAGLEDLSAAFGLRWTPSDLYLAVSVQDDEHSNSAQPADLWQGDSVQVAFDLGMEGGQGYDAVNDHELGFALLPGGSDRWRWASPAGAGAVGAEVAVRREGNTTSYEARIPSFELPQLVLAEGAVFGFSLLVNDADGGERNGWLEWTRGIGSAKLPGAFGVVALGPAGGGEGEGEGEGEGAPGGEREVSDDGMCAVSPAAGGAGPLGLVLFVALGLSLLRRSSER